MVDRPLVEVIMTRPGINTGFIPFGTTAHKVLVALYEAGDMTQQDLPAYLEIPDHDMRHLSSVLIRLVNNQFIYRSRKVPANPPLRRAIWLYTLTPTKTKKYKRKTPAERSRAYRAKRALVQPSVFTFRGEIKIWT